MHGIGLAAMIDVFCCGNLFYGILRGRNYDYEYGE